MTLSVERLKAQFQHPNVAAFARCVRSAESNNRDDGSAYRTLYGGEQVADLSTHPRIAKTSPWGYTSAAGAYQAMCAVPGRVETDTWGDFCRELGVPVDAMPFDEPTQDAFFVWCVRRRQALQNVIDGDLERAVDKCSFEWASFPPGRYGQPTTTIDKLRAVFLRYGGMLSNADLIQPAAPIEERTPALAPQPEKTMPLPILAILAAVGPIISELIPQVAKAFDRKAETGAKLEAATKIVDTLTKATGSVNIVEAVEKMQGSAEVLTAARNAVVTEPAIMGLLEIGGGIAEARRVAADPAQVPYWRNPAMIVTVLLAPLLYIVVIAVTFNLGGAGQDGWSDEMRSVVVTAIVTGLLGSLSGFWLGSSFGSTRKTDMINAQAEK